MMSSRKIYPILTCPKCNDVTFYKIEEFGRGYAKECKCKKMERFKTLSVLDVDNNEKTFENAELLTDKEKEYFASGEIFVEKFEVVKERGLGMLLFGEAGTGKTYLANCIANELRGNNKAVFSFNFSGYLNQIKKSENWGKEETKLLEVIKEADLIVIDDLGSELISEGFGKERLFNLIDTVYRNKKCVIITSNLNGEMLKKHLMFNGSDKIFDRLSERCKSYKFNWESKRKSINKKLWEDIL